MVLPRVRVIFALTLTSLAAHIIRLPSVTVIAAFWLMLRPALNKTLPLVVVMAAFTFTSRPQHATKLPPTAVTAALMFVSLAANRLSVVGVELDVQLTASLTKISPLPAPAGEVMVMLLVTSWAESVAPEMLPPGPMMKSCGSISQLPVWPSAEAVVMRAVSCTLTCAAEVSIKPPLPPFGALASRVPPTFTAPLSISASSLMVPLIFDSVCARITPVLLTTVPSRLPAPCAVNKTKPPSAWISPPFSTSALTAP